MSEKNAKQDRGVLYRFDGVGTPDRVLGGCIGSPELVGQAESGSAPSCIHGKKKSEVSRRAKVGSALYCKSRQKETALSAELKKNPLLDEGGKKFEILNLIIIPDSELLAYGATAEQLRDPKQKDVMDWHRESLRSTERLLYLTRNLKKMTVGCKTLLEHRLDTQLAEEYRALERSKPFRRNIVKNWEEVTFCRGFEKTPATDCQEVVSVSRPAWKIQEDFVTVECEAKRMPTSYKEWRAMYPTFEEGWSPSIESLEKMRQGEKCAVALAVSTDAVNKKFLEPVEVKAKILKEVILSTSTEALKGKYNDIYRKESVIVIYDGSGVWPLRRPILAGDDAVVQIGSFKSDVEFREFALRNKTGMLMSAAVKDLGNGKYYIPSVKAGFLDSVNLVPGSVLVGFESCLREEIESTMNYWRTMDTPRDVIQGKEFFLGLEKIWQRARQLCSARYRRKGRIRTGGPGVANSGVG